MRLWTGVWILEAERGDEDLGCSARLWCTGMILTYEARNCLAEASNGPPLTLRSPLS